MLAFFFMTRNLQILRADLRSEVFDFIIEVQRLAVFFVEVAGHPSFTPDGTGMAHRQRSPGSPGTADAWCVPRWWQSGPEGRLNPRCHWMCGATPAEPPGSCRSGCLRLLVDALFFFNGGGLAFAKGFPLGRGAAAFMHVCYCVRVFVSRHTLHVRIDVHIVILSNCAFCFVICLPDNHFFVLHPDAEKTHFFGETLPKFLTASSAMKSLGTFGCPRACCLKLSSVVSWWKPRESSAQGRAWTGGTVST